jgi:hypothetical protein
VFGWNTRLKVRPEIEVANWADNESRLSWTSRDVLETGGSLYDVTQIVWRGEPISKQKFIPWSNGRYDFEIGAPGVCMLFEYEHVISRGEFPACASLEIGGTGPRQRGPVALDLFLDPPKFSASLEDFGEVPEVSARIAAPGEAPPEPPGDEEPADLEEVTPGE